VDVVVVLLCRLSSSQLLRSPTQRARPGARSATGCAAVSPPRCSSSALHSARCIDSPAAASTGRRGSDGLRSGEPSRA